MQALEASDAPPSQLPLRLPRIGGLRILLGLLQGLILYLLYRAAEHHAWPSTQSLLFVPLVLLALFLPSIAISGLGHMDHRRQLLQWGLLPTTCASIPKARACPHPSWAPTG